MEAFAPKFPMLGLALWIRRIFVPLIIAIAEPSPAAQTREETIPHFARRLMRFRSASFRSPLLRIIPHFPKRLMCLTESLASTVMNDHPAEKYDDATFPKIPLRGLADNGKYREIVDGGGKSRAISPGRDIPLLPPRHKYPPPA